MHVRTSLSQALQPSITEHSAESDSQPGTMSSPATAAEDAQAMEADGIDGDIEEGGQVVSPVGMFVDRSSIIHPFLAAYFNTKTFSDLTVLAPDGRRLLCHQVVLSAGSKKFAKILEQPGILAEPELPVWGVDSDALETVLRCFYTGECRLTDQNIIPVMDAARRLDVTSLAQYCEGFVSKATQLHNCCQLLGQAMHFKMEELTQQILKFTETCFNDLVCHDEFFQSEPHVVVKLLSHHKPLLDDATLLRAGWEWLVSDATHGESLTDITSLLQLPEGLVPEDLLSRSKAAEHNITWRLPEPEDLPEIKEEDLGLGLDGNPALSTLHQAGLLAGLRGQLPLNMMLNLPGMNGSGVPNIQTASELLAQLGSANMDINGGGLDDMHGRRHGTGDNSDGSPAPYASPNPPRRSSSSRGASSKGYCQVDGCTTDLGGLRDYHQRYKICEYHLKIPSVIKDGVPQRFCQQCGRFQPTTEFEGQKRSCKARLQRHNDRRRKRLEEEPTGSYYSKRTNTTTTPGIPQKEPSDEPALGLATGTSNTSVTAGVTTGSLTLPGALPGGNNAVNALAAVAAAAAHVNNKNGGSNAWPAASLALLSELMSRVNTGAIQGTSQPQLTPTPPPQPPAPLPQTTPPQPPSLESLTIDATALAALGTTENPILGPADASLLPNVPLLPTTDLTDVKSTLNSVVATAAAKTGAS